MWYDALTSYMTGIGYAQAENGNEEFRKYWRNKPGESEIVHMIGKDILRFHAVYWPAFIMAAYPDQPEMLPTTVFAHGWIYYEQDKMSKSKGNVVYPEPIVDALDSFGAPGNDALRYYLLREAPFGQDMSFSYEGLIQRYNSDLANDLGNLANRTITMLNTYFNGEIPAPPVHIGSPSYPAYQWQQFAGSGNYQHLFQNYEFSQALDRMWQFVSLANKDLVQEAPWKLANDFKVNQPRIATVLYRTAEALRFTALLLYPVLPRAASSLWGQLGCEEHLGKIDKQRIDQLKWGDLKPGTKVGKPEPIFPRLDKAVTLAKLEELAEADRNRDKPKEALKSVETGKTPEAATAPESRTPSPESRTPSPESRVPSPAPATPSPESPAPSTQPPAPTATAEPAKISIEDFAKVEMRTGEIKTAERVPGATKLLKLQVDIGSEVRQVVAGIAEYYEPEKLIGMKVVVVTNLQPRKLRGVESNGMIVAASIGESGRPVLATFQEDVPNGARLK